MVDVSKIIADKEWWAEWGYSFGWELSSFTARNSAVFRIYSADHKDYILQSIDARALVGIAAWMDANVDGG